MKRAILLILLGISLGFAGCHNELIGLPAVSVDPGVVAEGGTFTLVAKPQENAMIKWFGPDGTVYDSSTWTRTFATRAMGGSYKVVQQIVVYDDTVSSDTVTIFVTIGQKWNTASAMAASPSDIVFPVDTTTPPAPDAPAADAAATEAPAADDIPPAAAVKFCSAEGTNKFHFNDSGKYRLTIQEMSLGSAEKYTVCTGGGGCSIIGQANTRCFVNGQVGDSWTVSVTGVCQIMSMMIEKATTQATISTEDGYVNGNVLVWQSDSGFKVKVLVEKI